MKTHCISALLFLTAGALLAADPTPVDKAKAAIAKLGSADNYSWTAKIEILDSPFTPGPVKGRAEKDGTAFVSQDFNDNTLQAVFKGDRAVVKVDDKWQLIDQADGFVAMLSGWLVASGTPVSEAENLAKKVKDLKPGDDGLLSGDYTDEGAKDLLTFKPRRTGGDNPPPPAPPKNAKGSVKFWVKDGALVKYQSHLTGKIAFGPDQQEQDFDMTRTVEIQDVGKTKLDLPSDAKKILETK